MEFSKTNYTFIKRLPLFLNSSKTRKLQETICLRYGIHPLLDAGQSLQSNSQEVAPKVQSKLLMWQGSQQMSPAQCLEM